MVSIYSNARGTLDVAKNIVYCEMIYLGVYVIEKVALKGPFETNCTVKELILQLTWVSVSHISDLTENWL